VRGGKGRHGAAGGDRTHDPWLRRPKIVPFPSLPTRNFPFIGTILAHVRLSQQQGRTWQPYASEAKASTTFRSANVAIQTKTFSKEADARRWATIIESEMERGVFVSRNEAEATLVAEVLTRYANEVLPTKRSEQSDKSRIKTLTEAFGPYRLASLNSSQVAQFPDKRL
jgi:hypothetical protein